VEFSRIPGLIELSRFLRYRVDSYKSLILVGFSRIPKLVELGRILDLVLGLSNKL